MKSSDSSDRVKNDKQGSLRSLKLFLPHYLDLLLSLLIAIINTIIIDACIKALQYCI